MPQHLDLYVSDRIVRRLLYQYLKRTAERGGCFFDVRQGISLGCPLSPLVAAFFLHEMDRALEKGGLFSVRFMDDIVVLAPTRWRLRRAVRLVNAVLERLCLSKHPGKTFIGRIERGFDFLGYRVSRSGLTAARTTIRNAMEIATRLYEHTSPLGMYLRRWSGWLRGGLDGHLDLKSPDLCLGGSPTTLQPVVAGHAGKGSAK